MLLFRIVFGLSMLAAIGCFAMSLATRDLSWRRRGVAILTWTLIAAAGFFGWIYLSSVLTSRP
jgi:hypothetical protein